MGGHIFLRVGDLEMAARVDEEAVAADRELFKRAPAGVVVYGYGYYGHNLHFIVRARTEQGLYQDARKAVDDLVARAAAEIASMPDMTDLLPAEPSLSAAPLRALG
jgi:hypothetical protein